MSIGVFAQGFFLQASLILALGAQNIFVLNSGLRRQRHLVVALISSICDALLIFVGVLGVASVFIRLPMLKIGLGLIGTGFLFYYGALKLREALRGVNVAIDSASPISLKQTILTTLGFSLLNPHVLLDTVVLIGGYSAKFSASTARFCFGLGASGFSILWFFALVLLASRGARLLNNPRAMRFISLLSGIVLIALAIKLGLDVAGWVKS